MNERVEFILPYVDIVRLRDRLRQGDVLSSEERERFAGSIISLEDVILFKRLLKFGAKPEVAGDAMFVLFTRGGFGNLNSEIRPWLETAGNQDTAVTESAPLVLAGCVRQLDDGTALRQLFEFSFQYDVKVVLAQVLDDAEDLTLDRLLRQSLTEQLDRLIADRGRTPSNRFLWTLRTYVCHERVQAYLHSFAVAGRVAALVSYALRGESLDWELLKASEPQDEFESRLVVNLALENLARGAKRDDPTFQVLRSRLSAAAQGELATGLSML